LVRIAREVHSLESYSILKHCSLMAAEAIKVELSRDANGDVVYMEAGSDFVDELLHILRAPMGAVMQCVATKRSEGEARSAMETFCGSVAQLRDPLFNSGTRDAVPAAYDFLDDKKAAKLHHCHNCGQQDTLISATCTCRPQHRPQHYWRSCNPEYDPEYPERYHETKEEDKKATKEEEKKEEEHTDLCTALSSNGQVCPHCAWCTGCAQHQGAQRNQVAVHQQQPSSDGFMKESAKFIITKKLDVFEPSRSSARQARPCRT